jgi:hypothetical protein
MLPKVHVKISLFLFNFLIESAPALGDVEVTVVQLSVPPCALTLVRFWLGQIAIWKVHELDEPVRGVAFPLSRRALINGPVHAVGFTTVNPAEALDASRLLVPAKLALSVWTPDPLDVIEHDAIPFELVIANRKSWTFEEKIRPAVTESHWRTPERCPRRRSRSRTLRVSAAARSNSARACVARPEACSIVSSSSYEMTPLPGNRFVVTRWRSEVNSNCQHRFLNCQTTAS